MAIERDVGAGGMMGQAPQIESEDVLVEELGQSPGIFEFDAMTFVISEVQAGSGPVFAIAGATMGLVHAFRPANSIPVEQHSS